MGGGGSINYNYNNNNERRDTIDSGGAFVDNNAAEVQRLFDVFDSVDRLKRPAVLNHV
jgi:hypothetical protein